MAISVGDMVFRYFRAVWYFRAETASNDWVSTIYESALS